MSPEDTAREYLARHETYLEALRALLEDLGEAQKTRRTDDEVHLCDAIDALRAITGRAEARVRWTWSGGSNSKTDAA